MNKKIIHKILTENKDRWKGTQYIQQLKDGRKYITNGEFVVIFYEEEKLLEEYKLNSILNLDEIILPQTEYKHITEEDQKIIENIKEIENKLICLPSEEIGYKKKDVVIINNVSVSIKYVKWLIEIIGKKEIKNIEYTTNENKTLYIQTPKYDIAIITYPLNPSEKTKIKKLQKILI